jgi:hypothetical protein
MDANNSNQHDSNLNLNHGSEPANPTDNPTTNPNTRVMPTPDNPRGYPPFEMHRVPNYTNNQLTYYYTAGAIPTAELTRFHQLMKQRKVSMDLLGWDGTSDHASGDENNDNDNPADSRTIGDLITPRDDSDSDCPIALPGFKGFKVSPSNLPQLEYDSTVAEYSNWLTDLKTAFDGDPAKFPTSRQKVMLASLTLGKQLKTVFNSASTEDPILTRHWRKFEHWLRDTVLHQGSDRQKLSSEFTAARQKFSEDPNQFYIRLFNLGIQSGRTVTMDDYRTRLLRPLRALIDQHDRDYSAIKDCVTHAGKLWQTLDLNKLQQEFKERKEARKRQEDQRQPRSSRGADSQSQSRRQSDRQDSRQKDSQSRDKLQLRKRLSDEEHQHRKDNNLCLKCGYPGHQIRDCEHPFNPNRVLPKEDKTKSQPTSSRKRARTQTVRVESASDQDSGPESESGSESESERPAKRSKN